jgi:hypothetical protein
MSTLEKLDMALFAYLLFPGQQQVLQAVNHLVNCLVLVFWKGRDI